MLSKLVAEFCLVFGCTAPAPAVTSTSLIPEPYIALIEASSNPSRMAAQIKAESNWKPMALSHAGAQGLGQIMPVTGKWLAVTHCAKYGPYAPYNPDWNLACSIKYMEILERTLKFKDPCFRRFVAEQRYNGGGWILIELRRANENDLNKSRLKCTRASWACRENYAYPKRISRLQQSYYSNLQGRKCPYKPNDGDL